MNQPPPPEDILTVPNCPDDVILNPTVTVEDADNLLNEISELINSTTSPSDLVTASNAESNLDKKMEEAEDKIKQLEISNAETLNRHQIQQLRVRLKKIQLINAARKERTSRASAYSSIRGIPKISTDLAIDQDHRNRLLSGVNTLNDQNRRVSKILLVSQETESIGIEVLGKLQTQTEQFKYADKKVEITAERVTKAEVTLSKMVRRKKLMQCTWIVLVVIVILIALSIGTWFFLSKK